MTARFPGINKILAVIDRAYSCNECFATPSTQQREEESTLSLCMFFCFLFQAPTEFEPPHLKEIAPVERSLNVIAPTWVIADLTVGVDGYVRFPKVLKGEEPFRSNVLSSVSRWFFTPARATVPVEARLTGIFLFRSRDIFPAPAPDLSEIRVAGSDRPPIPISLSDPGYMPTSIAEGEVVLELQISDKGSLERVRVVQGVPGLTEFTERAIRSWTFTPASWTGRSVKGTVIVVISYLRPVVVG